MVSDVTAHVPLMFDQQLTDWLRGLETRHLADLRFPEVSRALRALSSTYVERRSRIGEGAALSGAGKRAAFALFYGPLHALLVRQIALQLPAKDRRARLLVDLGCGTGLVGITVSDIAAMPMVGVDLSPEMLRRARERQLYAELHEADIEAFLAREQRVFGAVLAGDVLPYFGDLQPVCALVAKRLVAGGFIIFTVEELVATDGTPPPWQLGRLGHY